MEYVIDKKQQITEVEFRNHYLDKKPLLLKGFTTESRCIQKWSLDYFSQHFAGLQIATKEFMPEQIKVHHTTMGEYITSLRNYFAKMEQGKACSLPPYCHDIPIFNIAPALIKDVEGFPSNWLPKWYQTNWWLFCQFFMSVEGSVTPLHFDTLRTHNLFFQVQGRKRFTLIPWEKSKACDRRGWRWFNADPEASEHNNPHNFDSVPRVIVDVEPGDILYMPAGTLHHVRSLDFCISFNIDFHTRASLLQTVPAIANGMPLENIYYNLLSALGVVCGLPQKLLFPLYRKYLNYIS